MMLRRFSEGTGKRFIFVRVMMMMMTMTVPLTNPLFSFIYPPFMTNSKRKVFEDSISFSVRAWNYNSGGQWLSFLCGTEYKLLRIRWGRRGGGGGKVGYKTLSKSCLTQRPYE